MSIIDEYKWSWNWVWQPLLASAYLALAIYVVTLFSVDKIDGAVGLSALASTSFGVFAVPTARTSSAYSIAVGYAIAVTAGLLMKHVISGLGFTCLNLLTCNADPTTIGLAAVSIAMVMLTMHLFRVQHPPAAGFALILVINVQMSHLLPVILFLAAILLAIQFILGDRLRDLIE